MIPLSILDLAVIGEEQSSRQAILGSREMAKAAELAGFYRYWLAEHHGMQGIASSATAVMLSQAGEVTERIRIGSGGVMLPNHAPLMVAEQFGTLSDLFPGRVDLGLGRAPGSDPRTSKALRRPTMEAVERYSEDIDELQRYLSEDATAVLAIPGHGSKIPLWLLGSSLYSAQLAAQKGLPFAFASHFAPDFLVQAITMYREQFQPSAQLKKPYVMAAANVVIGESEEQARLLYTSLQQQFLNIRRGLNLPFPKPQADLEEQVSARELAMVEQTLRYSFCGSATSVQHQLQQFIRLSDIDELMISVPIYDLTSRLAAVRLLGDMDIG